MSTGGQAQVLPNTRFLEKFENNEDFRNTSKNKYFK